MKELGDVLSKILAIAKPKVVAVFGTHAKGKTGKLSDIDVLMITQSEEDKKGYSYWKRNSEMWNFTCL